MKAGDIAAHGSIPKQGRRRWTPVATAVTGVAGGVAVALATAVNGAPASAHFAIILRLAIIAAVAAAAIAAQTARAGSRLGQLLGTITLFCVLWMLNGASWGPAHAVGVVLSATAPVVIAYLMLAHPSGRLHRRPERLLIAGAGGTLVAGSLAALAITHYPALGSSAADCAGNCANDVFGFSLPSGNPGALRFLVMLSLLVLAVGTAGLALNRGRLPSPLPIQRAYLPMRFVAVAAALLAAFLVSHTNGRDVGSALDTAYAAIVLLTALAVLLGLALERLFLARALAWLVDQLSVSPGRDAQGLVTGAIGDPSLQIVSRRLGSSEYVDAGGRPVAWALLPKDRCVTYVQRAGRPVAAVIYDAELADQERLIQAAAAAALLRVEQARLHADLQASTRELALSRRRLADSVQRERRRIERDLHDGVQQEVLGLRLKLDLATEMLDTDPEEGERLLGAVGRQMDTVLDEVRSLARGIYPAILHEHGLPEAIRSAARIATVPASVRASKVARYPEQIEVAVYFSCLEALENASKHAGSRAAVVITLWERDGRIIFEVRDDGRGFDPESMERGRGLTNMRDRLEAVGGSLMFLSTPGKGVRIRGEAPTVARAEDAEITAPRAGPGRRGSPARPPRT
jgi:signal transduction histidine kinase